MGDRKLGHLSPQEFQAVIGDRRRARMEKIDSLHPDLRVCVHDYGFTVVDAFMRLGVTKAKHVRHLVECVLDEFSPTRGSCSAQGIRERVDGRSLP
jgi:hypothetical protein